MKFLRYTFSIVSIIVLTLITPVDLGAKSKPKGNDGKFVVVIDAGHGGKDAGACDNNAKEKDINLGVALQLADLLKKEKDVKVVLTRDDDNFLSLQERADVANSNKGDLFISIHTNSLDKNNPRRTTVAGSSVYVLGLHKDQNNMTVARRENSVIQLERNFEENYEGFNPDKDESYIIFEMAQKKNLSQSMKFAGEVQNQLVKVAGRGDRGVHQAGFWVLWATSMPSVLIELDFITNPNSAKYIASETGQKKLAEAIFNGVKNYRKTLREEASATEQQQNEAFISGDEVAVLQPAASSAANRLSQAPESTGNKGTRRTANRKRRSDYARDLSSKRDIVANEIMLLSETDGLAKVDKNKPAPEVNQEPEENLNLKGKKNKKEKKPKAKKEKKPQKQAGVNSASTNRRPGVAPFQTGNSANMVAQGKSAATKPAAKPEKQKKEKTEKKNNNQQSADNSQGLAAERQSSVVVDENNAVNRPSTRSRRRNTPGNVSSATMVKDDRRQTVYKIRLMQSDKHLTTNNPAFCGLTPISSYKENNTYFYTYGESTNLKDIEAILPQVKEKIPGAVVIKVTSSINK